MNTIPISKDEVFDDFPSVIDWFEKIKRYLDKDIDNSKLELFYSFGFFIQKVKDPEELYTQLHEKCSKMKYEERLKFELSKVRVSLTIRNGNFVISDRLPKGKIPQIIIDIVSEITKIKMTVESQYHGNIEVSDSIPDLDASIISFDEIKDLIKPELGGIEYDIDSILDKISNQGIDSLSRDEKDFLDKKSKGI